MSPEPAAQPAPPNASRALGLAIHDAARETFSRAFIDAMKRWAPLCGLGYVQAAMRPDAAQPMEKPHFRAFRDGASRTRTDDLLGAIQLTVFTTHHCAS